LGQKKKELDYDGNALDITSINPKKHFCKDGRHEERDITRVGRCAFYIAKVIKEENGNILQ
jgi:hypothetical protein